MKPELSYEPVPNEPDVFYAYLEMPSGKRLPVGRLERSEPGKWRLNITGGSTAEGAVVPEAVGPVVTADTAQEAMDKLKGVIATAHVSTDEKDRRALITTAALTDFVYETLGPTRALARESGAVAGLLAGLARTLSAVIHEDLEDAKEAASVLETFNSAVQNDLRLRRRARLTRQKLEEALEPVLDALRTKFEEAATPGESPKDIKH